MQLASELADICRHICLPVITGRGVGSETCEVDNVFPPDDLCFSLDTYANCGILFNVYLDV